MHPSCLFLGQRGQGVAFWSQLMAQIINSWQEGTMSIMAWSFNSKITLVLSATEYSENVINVKNRTVMGETDWIAVSQDRDRWLTLVNAVTNL